MTKRAGLQVLGAMVCAASVLLAASCATSKGSTLGKVISTQNSSAPSQTTSRSAPQEPAQNPPGSSKGLQVLTDPSYAEVWIDGDFKGLSPYVMDGYFDRMAPDPAEKSRVL